MPGDATPRLVARVLVIDPRDRVLLLHFRIWNGPEVWIPAGGGLEAGETPEAAATRELLEETGIALDAPLRLAWVRDARYFNHDVRETCFLARLPTTPEIALEPAPGSPADLLGFRWWTPAEIEAHARAHPDLEFTPPDLAARLTEVLGDNSSVTSAPER
jgi:8-oxo-dGTP pyrophosphatase MutT (NUDIX family)